MSKCLCFLQTTHIISSDSQRYIWSMFMLKSLHQMVDSFAGRDASKIHDQFFFDSKFLTPEASFWELREFTEIESIGNQCRFVWRDAPFVMNLHIRRADTDASCCPKWNFSTNKLIPNGLEKLFLLVSFKCSIGCHDIRSIVFLSPFDSKIIKQMTMTMKMNDIKFWKKFLNLLPFSRKEKLLVIGQTIA